MFWETLRLTRMPSMTVTDCNRTGFVVTLIATISRSVASDIAYPDGDPI